jgi:hypothetical protein
MMADDNMDAAAVVLAGKPVEEWDRSDAMMR